MWWARSGTTRNVIPSQLKAYFFVYLHVTSVVGYRSGTTRNVIPSQLKSYFFVYLNLTSEVGYSQKSRHLPAEITLSLIRECEECGQVPPEMRYPLSKNHIFSYTLMWRVWSDTARKVDTSQLKSHFLLDVNVMNAVRFDQKCYTLSAKIILFSIPWCDESGRIPPEK